MSYQRRPSKPWLVVRRKGVSPIRVVAGEWFRTKKKAEKEAGEWNNAYLNRKGRIGLQREAQMQKLTPHG